MMKFKSAVDSWYYLLIVATAITLLVTIVPTLRAGQISISTVFITVAISLGLPLWLLFSTYYQVSDNLLVIRTGPFFWKIKITDIHSAKPSRNLISSPALSINRIELKYGKNRKIRVSPKDKDGFLKAIGHERYSS